MYGLEGLRSDMTNYSHAEAIFTPPVGDKQLENFNASKNLQEPLCPSHSGGKTEKNDPVS